MNIKITPPEDLKLPETEEGQAPYFYPDMTAGSRCAWFNTWLVADVAKDGSESFKRIEPKQWRIDDGSPDLEKMPDDMLMSALADVSCGDIAAARLFFNKPLETGERGGKLDAWRYEVRMHLQPFLNSPKTFTSPFNPPNPKLLKGIHMPFQSRGKYATR